MNAPLRSFDAENNISNSSNRELEDLELKVLLEAIYERYGYDFRQYSMPHMKRQLFHFAKQEGVSTLSGVQEKVLHNPAELKRLLWWISIGTTSLFRDPHFSRRS